MVTSDLLDLILDRYYPRDENGNHYLPRSQGSRVMLDRLRKFPDPRPASVRWPARMP